MTIPQPALPATWRWQPLDSLSRVKVSTVDKKSYPDEVPVRLCNYTDVYYQDVITSDLAFMEATASAEQISRFSVQAGDVPITKDSETSDDIGRPSYVPKDLPGVVYGYHLAIYRSFDPHYSRFIRYLFDSSLVRAELETRTPGVTRVGLSQDTLRNLRVPTPPPPVAAKIADYLDHETAEIDAFIAELDTFADLLLQRKGAYREHLFGRFVTPTGTASLRGGLAEVDYRIGTNADPGSLLSVSISNGVSRWVDRTDDLPRATDLSNYKRVEPGDVVLNRMRAFQGAVGVSQWAGIASPDYAVLRTRPGFDPGFIEQIIRSDRFVQEIKARLRGIGNEDSGQIRTPRISVADLVRIPTSIPDIDTQIAHVHDWQDFEANTAERLSDAQHAIDLARERRAALITAAVTGQIDVSAKNKPAAEQLEADVAQGLHREYA